MRKPHLKIRIGTSYLPSQVVQASAEIVPFRSLCTVYSLGPEPTRLFLDLVRVLQDSLSLKSPAGLLKSPSLYAVAIVSTYPDRSSPKHSRRIVPVGASGRLRSE